MAEPDGRIRGLEGRVEVSPGFEALRLQLEALLLSLQLYPGGIGSGPDALWDAFGVSEDGPADDRRVFALRAAMEQLTEHWPTVAAREDLRAFQIVGTSRKQDGKVLHELRVNQAVRGALTLRCGPKAEPPHKLGLELQFDPADDEVLSGAQYVALLRKDEGRVRAIVFIDEVTLIATQATPRQVAQQIDRSLPPATARKRWRGLVARLPSLDEVPGIYFELGTGAPDSQGLAAGAVEGLEASVLAGLPSRRSGLSMEPLPEDLDAGTASGDPGDPTAAAEHHDLERAVSELAARDQEIIRLHMIEGLTEESIGERLGITQQAVSKRLKKALLKLRKLMSH